MVKKSKKKLCQTWYIIVSVQEYTTAIGLYVLCLYNMQSDISLANIFWLQATKLFIYNSFDKFSIIFR
jgi:hypothetical protein